MWPFHGRDAEVVSVGQALGQRVTVLITGPPGQGKSRLAWECVSGVDGAAYWVTATRAAAAIPLAAVLPLIPPDAVLADRTHVLRAAEQRFRRESAVIGVDDAPVLDEASAALLAHLSRAGLARLVLTARSGEALPDALAPLIGEVVELPPLPEDAVDHLIDHASAVRVPVKTRRRLHRLAGGNPLALRELLHGARPGGLADLVTARLAGLREAGRNTIEFVACGEPLSFGLLERLVGVDAISDAEDSGLIIVERSGSRRVVRLGHPLYGEVLRAGQTVSRATRTYRRLAGALLASPLRRHGDALLAALWQVEGGHITQPQLVRTGARLAIGHADLQLAERLARAVRDVDPGAEADRLLAEIAVYRGRLDEAKTLLVNPPDGDRTEWTVTRAETMYWGDGDLTQALHTLDSAGGEPLARGSRSWLLFFDGRCGEAAYWAAGVLGDPAAEPKATAWAGAAATAANGFLGRLPTARQAYATAAQRITDHTGRLPWAQVEIDTGLCLAYLASGRPRAAEKLALAGYRTALDGGAAMMVCGWALYAGLAALARGHHETAERLLAEAQAGFDVDDTFRLSRTIRAARAAAAALAGRSAAADLMAAADERAHPSDQVFEPWIEGWRAWVEYATGDLAAAVEATRRSHDLADRAGMPIVAALARYDLARLGVHTPPPAGRGSPVGGLVGLLDRAAAALADPDAADRLEQAARSLARRGYDLHAAELWRTAARRHRRRQRWAESDLAQAAGSGLLEAARSGLAEAKTPLMRAGENTSLLTFRERQVLLLAAEHTSVAIAAQLGLAVPTVNNNLARAYQKLGIRGRADLRRLLR
ncbi:DNA-binding CsgD family transcriptional regulator [Hamadaea flava]|uniref:LuxR C-terminal-related transcriptional regulator n=1 Tax=Hamadaea flava TaxID=1742688 RepID=A0ABV8LVR4_9ACTN|nr:LuxR C-terminal-related transcriptional regulator [Hamadaea flava]MCP2329194.1 DNA-binding CsgD family transcriptional regulator [Hamadaea flava]